MNIHLAGEELCISENAVVAHPPAAPAPKTFSDVVCSGRRNCSWYRRIIPGTCWRNAQQFPTLQTAYDAAASLKKDPFVFVVPDAKRTLPLINYEFE